MDRLTWNIIHYHDIRWITVHLHRVQDDVLTCNIIKSCIHTTMVEPQVADRRLLTTPIPLPPLLLPRSMPPRRRSRLPSRWVRCRRYVDGSLDMEYHSLPWYSMNYGAFTSCTIWCSQQVHMQNTALTEVIQLVKHNPTSGISSTNTRCI